MREHLERVIGFLEHRLRGGEVVTCYFTGEESDFVRLNKGRVRQAGRVRQMRVHIRLIESGRQTQGDLTLSGDAGEDERRVERLLLDLREILPLVPEDPFLSLPNDAPSGEREGRNALPDAREVIESVIRASDGRDLVGIYAGGGIFAGYADSMGQRNWFSTHSFFLDWSFFAHGDKGVKARYAGFEWDPQTFARTAESTAARLDTLARPPVTLAPGDYRVCLSPAAVNEFVGMVAGRGFSYRARRYKKSSLMRMTEEGKHLSPVLTLRENTTEGLAPNFQEEGFPRPASLTLIERGAPGAALVSPRSAKEFGVPANGASESETPLSLDMSAGEIPAEQVLRELGTGIYVGGLWYLNYSDLPACRITGLTRFATFWVEGGEIRAPLNVMRFDETAYRAFGENLVGLTREREFVPDDSTYGQRSVRSSRVPGAIVEGFRFTH